MEVPTEKVRSQAAQLCGEYLQGAWKKVSPLQLRIRQISGGLSNVVFYVGLPTGVTTTGQEPAEVLLRLFGDLSCGPAHQYRMMTETVVFTMLAERSLGPRLLAVFPGGRLEEFIFGHSMSFSEMRSVRFSSEIAKNVALVHSLNIPVSKEPTWLFDTMRMYLNKLRPINLEEVPDEEVSAASIVANIDFESEIEYLAGLIIKISPPVVFSHNDINTGNILVKDVQECSDPVVLIDYEFSSYNYRGFDLANHFNEWMYDYRRKDFPYYYRNTNKYPSKEEQRAWVVTYLDTFREKQRQIQENNPVPGGQSQDTSSVSSVLREVEVFSLASHLLWTLWSLKQAQYSNIPFAYYSFARDRMEDYRVKKEQVEEEGVIELRLLSSL